MPCKRVWPRVQYSQHSRCVHQRLEAEVSAPLLKGGMAQQPSWRLTTAGPPPGCRRPARPPRPHSPSPPSAPPPARS